MMPYTKWVPGTMNTRQQSKDLEEKLQAIGGRCLERGDLNFCIMNLVIGYAKQKGRRYFAFEDIDGALTEVGREFFRRVVAPYEDEKIKENGDLDWGDLLPERDE